jgi:hypothetical protein
MTPRKPNQYIKDPMPCNPPPVDAKPNPLESLAPGQLSKVIPPHITLVILQMNFMHIDNIAILALVTVFD